MAFRVTEVNGHPVTYNKKSFTCMSQSDIATLPRVGIRGTQVLTAEDEPDANDPVCYGSTATVATPFGVYHLAANNEWMKME